MLTLWHLVMITVVVKDELMLLFRPLKRAQIRLALVICHCPALAWNQPE